MRILSRFKNMEFTYPPLPSPKHTRVIQLLPASSYSSMIKIRLVDTHVDCPRDYEALSYTWDGQARTEPIECNGGHIKVTINAESALRRLRRKYRSRYLWVDSICIDQESPSETGIQIGFMDKVYRKAKSVAIWLGRRAPNLPLAYRLSYNRERYCPDHFYDEYENVAALVRICSGWNPHKPELDLVDWTDSLLDWALSHSYWNRAWTLQEFMLNDACYFYTDHGRISRDNLRRLLELYERKSSSIHLTAWSLRAGEDMRLSVKELFALLPSLQATKDNDRVFALISVFPKLLGSVKIDVNQDKAKTYADAARSIVTATGQLEILSFACQSRKVSGCPSWAPDWSAENCTDPIPAPHTEGPYAYLAHDFSKSSWHTMQASGSSKAEFSFTRGLTTLRVKGINMSDVSDLISEPMGDLQIEKSNPSLVASNGADFAYLVARHRFCCRYRYIFGGRKLEQQLRRCAQFMWRNTEDYWIDYWVKFARSPAEKAIRTLRDLRWQANHYNLGMILMPKPLDPCAKIEGEVRRFLQLHPRFFATEDGVLGIGRDMRPGDTVAFIAGCNRPFILRRVSNSRSHESYRLVEEVYLNGMDRRGALWLDQEARLQSFDLL